MVSVCFDLSGYDLFRAGTGATVVLARQEEVQDPAALRDSSSSKNISELFPLGLLVQYLEDRADSRDDSRSISRGDWIPRRCPSGPAASSPACG